MKNFLRITFAVAACFLWASAANAWTNPDYLHTQTVTGAPQGANDLHVVVSSTARGGTVSTPFGIGTITGANKRTLNFSGQGLPANGTATVTWSSKFETSTIDSGTWTNNTDFVGNVGFRAVTFDANDVGGGLVNVTLTNNSGSPINYSGLQVYDAADDTFFTLTDYLDNMTTGSSVSLNSSSFGPINSGATLDIATFSPSQSAGFYSAGSILLDGELFAIGATAAPIPGVAWLFVSGLGLFGWLGKRQR